VCACVDNQQSRGIVIARLRSSVQSFLHQRRDLLQLTYPYLTEDREPTFHHLWCRSWAQLKLIDPFKEAAPRRLKLDSVY
jgi:hypothetical protein